MLAVLLGGGIAASLDIIYACLSNAQYSRAPLWTGVDTVIEAPTLTGCSQNVVPVTGSSEASEVGSQTISCRVPPAAMIIG